MSAATTSTAGGGSAVKDNKEANAVNGDTTMKLNPLEIVKLVFGFSVTMLLVLVVFTGIANRWCVSHLHIIDYFFVLPSSNPTITGASLKHLPLYPSS